MSANEHMTQAAPALSYGHTNEQHQQHQHDNHLSPATTRADNVQAVDYGSSHPVGMAHAYPSGDPIGSHQPLSAAHHPYGPADPLAPYYPGARRSKQKQVTGLARAMPTYEEMQLKKAAEHRKREGHDAEGHSSSRYYSGNATHLDSISDPNLRVVLAEILNALHHQNGASGAMTPFTMSPPMSRIPTRTGNAPLSRIPTVQTVAEAEQILAPEEDDDDSPNPIKRFTNKIREPVAEFFGTLLLLMFGNGVNQQFFLSSNPDVSGLLRGTYLSVSFCWGIGVMVGVYVAGGISGAHLNPAVTLSLAVFRGFPKRKILPYVVAQVLGAMVGSAMVYLLYNRAVSIYEGGPDIRTVTDATSTAGLYTTFPLAYMGVANAFFNEFLDTAILIMTIFAIGDSNNTPPPDGMAPIVLLFLILGIGAALGSQTAYAINPARDMGPRLMLWMAGYGTELWTAYNWYWVWCPLAAPLCGGVVGGFLYDLFLYKGLESPLNARWGNTSKRHHEESGMAPVSNVDSNEKSTKEHV